MTESSDDVHIEIDRGIIRQVAPEGVDFSVEVEDRILLELHEQMIEILSVLQPVCPGKVGANELRRLLSLKGYKICF